MGKNKNTKKRTRSLANQSNYAISQSYYRKGYGRSKHADRANKICVRDRTYSSDTASRLRRVSNSLCQFIKDESGFNIKRIAELNTEVVQAFVDKRAETLSKATMTNYKDSLGKLEKIYNTIFGLKLDIMKDVVFPKMENDKTRNFVLPEADYRKLDQSFKGSRSLASEIPFITHSIGTRIREVIEIRPEDIDLNNHKVFIRKGKGNKTRWVQYEEKDSKRWADIKKKTLDNGREKICGDIKKNSANRAITRQMQKCGVQYVSGNVNHSIRKNYAQRLMWTSLGHKLSTPEDYLIMEKEIKELNPRDERIRDVFMNIVQVNLGHENVKFRRDLFDIYIRGK